MTEPATHAPPLGASAQDIADATRSVLADLPEEGLLSFYRDLHAHPELSMREHRTAGRLAARLRAAGFTTFEGIGGTGVAGVLRNGEGPVVMLRADLDALPVTEETGLPYTSRVDGVMHACGHDVHVTCLVGTAEALAAAPAAWSGTLLVVGQPGEETAEGAIAMLRDGLFDRCPRPEVILGQHVGPAPLGTAGHRAGTLMAAATDVEIRVFGRGGHGSSPEQCVDPVVAAAHLVTRLQAVVAREVPARESAVLTVGTLSAGTKANIIPDEARLTLNIRTQKPAVRALLLTAIRRVAEAECAASGCPRPPHITLDHDFPVTANDPATTERVTSVHTALLGPEAVSVYEPLMGSEDVGVFGMAEHNGGTDIPYCYWFIGTTAHEVWDAAPGSAPADKLLGVPGNHTARFSPDPASVRHGVATLTAAALAWLAASR